MPDIIKVKPKGTIKSLEKNIVGVQKLKNNLITTKEKINEFTIDDDNNSGEEYAGRRIQNDISYVARKGIKKSNEIGKKSTQETLQNLIKEKQKIDILKSRIKENKAKELKNVVNRTNKTIKSGTKKSVKMAKNSTKLTKKGIKTAEQVAKSTKRVAKESIKMSQRASKLTKKTIQLTIKGTKLAVKATIATIKEIIAGTKAIIAVIAAVGWIAVIIILVIVLIAGMIAAIFNSDGGVNYADFEIPNSQIVLVAKAQIGNEGGDKFWKWYGFDEHIQWCACYVSWCANECGLIDKEIIPKFSVCSDGIKWFKEKKQWQDRNDNYYPIIGDIIFFDWIDENGNQDGISDHVGIVTRTDITNKTIYTIEGNTDDECAERMYSLNDLQVIGYGTPKYQ